MANIIAALASATGVRILSPPLLLVLHAVMIRRRRKAKRRSRIFDDDVAEVAVETSPGMLRCIKNQNAWVESLKLHDKAAVKAWGAPRFSQTDTTAATNILTNNDDNSNKNHCSGFIRKENNYFIASHLYRIAVPRLSCASPSSILFLLISFSLRPTKTPLLKQHNLSTVDYLNFSG